MDPNRPGTRGGFFAVPDIGPPASDTPGGVSLQKWDVEDAVPYSPKSIRRADHSDRSGGFTRLPSSKTYQSRVWLRALPGE